MWVGKRWGGCFCCLIIGWSCWWVGVSLIGILGSSWDLGRWKLSGGLRISCLGVVECDRWIGGE